MAYSFYYTYICEPSSETRGRRPIYDGGCFRMNTHFTHAEISDEYKPQTRCKFCGRRPRLNEGNVQQWYSQDDAILIARNHNEAQDFISESTTESTTEYTTEYTTESGGEEE